MIAGFAAFTKHLSYLPHSGSVFPELGSKVAGYKTTTGSLHFPVDTPLPKTLVRQLVTVKLRQAFPDEPRNSRPEPRAVNRRVAGVGRRSPGRIGVDPPTR